MDPVRLKQLIATEPLNAGRTDAQVLAWTQEASGAFAGEPIRTTDLITRFGIAVLPVLNKIETDGVTILNAKWLLRLLEGSGFDLGSAAHRAMLDQAVADATLTSAQRNAIKNMARSLNRVEALGGGVVTAENVKEARALG